MIRMFLLCQTMGDLKIRKSKLILLCLTRCKNQSLGSKLELLMEFSKSKKKKNNNKILKMRNIIAHI